MKAQYGVQCVRQGNSGATLAGLIMWIVVIRYGVAGMEARSMHALLARGVATQGLATVRGFPNAILETEFQLLGCVLRRAFDVRWECMNRGQAKSPLYRASYAPREIIATQSA